MIAEGDDLRSQWARMKEFGHEVNATGYRYRPASQNSNSFAAEALRRGGFFGPGTAFPEILDDRLLAIEPASGETRPLRVPAFSARLKNPINVFEHRIQDGRTPMLARLIQSTTSGPQPQFQRPGTNKPIQYLSRGSVHRQVRHIAQERQTQQFRPQTFAPGRPNVDDRFANWNDSDGAMTSLAPHRDPPPEEDNRPPGIFSGKPMPDHPVPPSIFGFPEPERPMRRLASAVACTQARQINVVDRHEGNLPPAIIFGNREINA